MKELHYKLSILCFWFLPCCIIHNVFGQNSRFLQVQQEFTCPPGYTRRPGSLNCYKFYWIDDIQGVDWDFANKRCQLDSEIGHLLVIDDIGEYQFVQFLWPTCSGDNCNKQYFWLGLTSNSGQWAWNDQTPLPYNAPWDIGYPIKSGNCAALVYKNNKVVLINTACYVPFFFVCEVDLTPNPCPAVQSFLSGRRRKRQGDPRRQPFWQNGPGGQFQTGGNGNGGGAFWDTGPSSFNNMDDSNANSNDNNNGVQNSAQSAKTQSAGTAPRTQLIAQSLSPLSLAGVAAPPPASAPAVSAGLAGTQSAAGGSSPPVRTGPFGPMYFGHPFYNNKFIYCSLDQGPLVKNCPAQLFWNNDAGQCSPNPYGSASSNSGSPGGANGPPNLPGMLGSMFPGGGGPLQQPSVGRTSNNNSASAGGFNLPPGMMGAPGFGPMLSGAGGNPLMMGMGAPGGIPMIGR